MPKVLIVDDNAANLYLLQALMAGHGYEVVQARNGAEALEQARGGPPDLVISDILMPGMDGFALCREWRLDTRLKGIPFVFYTATYTDPKDEQFALSLGADGFLIKPTEPESFIQAIQAVVAKHQSQELIAHAEAPPCETRYLKEYNEALIRKLEDKLEQLAERDVFNQAILNAMTALVAVLDERGKLLAVNNAWERYAREEMVPEFMRPGVGANLLEIGQRDPNALTDLTRRIMTGIRQVIERDLAEFELEFPNQVPGGEQWFLMRVTPLGQAMAGAVMACFDITERKRMEEALQEASQRKDEFLAMLSHELKNPLAPICSSIEILRQAGPAPPLMQRQHERIERHVRHLARLVDDLLDVARITRGQIELRKRPLHLAEVIVQAVEMNAPLIESRRHKLHIPDPLESINLEADPVRLAQAIGNLLANAAKFTEEGGQIWLEAGREGGEAIIRVRDSGMGIAPEMLPHVFELFVQDDRSLDRARGGLGIGLTLAHKIIQMHGGTLEARSGGVAQGSEFTIRLPALPDEIIKNAATTQPVHNKQIVAPRRILVVDDVVDSAESLADVLRLFGHDVHTASSGRAALSEVRVFQPDLIMLDIGMPGMDGYEVARHLRQEHAEGLVIVALTGYGTAEDQRRAREAGFDLHLTKPVEMDRLHEVLSIGCKA